MNLRPKIQLLLVWLCIVSSRCQRRPPNYSADALPDTSFSCSGRQAGGYYADVEAGCQMFHVCPQPDGPSFRFLCPNDTVFDQQHLICANWFQVACQAAAGHFELFKIDSGAEPVLNAIDEDNLPDYDDYDYHSGFADASSFSGGSPAGFGVSASSPRPAVIAKQFEQVVAASTAKSVSSSRKSRILNSEARNRGIPSRALFQATSASTPRPVVARAPGVVGSRGISVPAVSSTTPVSVLRQSSSSRNANALVHGKRFKPSRPSPAAASASPPRAGFIRGNPVTQAVRGAPRPQNIPNAFRSDVQEVSPPSASGSALSIINRTNVTPSKNSQPARATLRPHAAPTFQSSFPGSQQSRTRLRPLSVTSDSSSVSSSPSPGFSGFSTPRPLFSQAQRPAITTVSRLPNLSSTENTRQNIQAVNPVAVNFFGANASPHITARMRGKPGHTASSISLKNSEAQVDLNQSSSRFANNNRITATTFRPRIRPLVDSRPSSASRASLATTPEPKPATVSSRSRQNRKPSARRPQTSFRSVPTTSVVTSSVAKIPNTFVQGRINDNIGKIEPTGNTNEISVAGSVAKQSSTRTGHRGRGSRKFNPDIPGGDLKQLQFWRDQVAREAAKEEATDNANHQAIQSSPLQQTPPIQSSGLLAQPAVASPRPKVSQANTIRPINSFNAPASPRQVNSFNSISQESQSNAFRLASTTGRRQTAFTNIRQADPSNVRQTSFRRASPSSSQRTTPQSIRQTGTSPRQPTIPSNSGVRQTSNTHLEQANLSSLRQVSTTSPRQARTSPQRSPAPSPQPGITPILAQGAASSKHSTTEVSNDSKASPSTHTSFFNPHLDIPVATTLLGNGERVVSSIEALNRLRAQLQANLDKDKHDHQHSTAAPTAQPAVSTTASPTSRVPSPAAAPRSLVSSASVFSNRFEASPTSPDSKPILVIDHFVPTPLPPIAVTPLPPQTASPHIIRKRIRVRGRPSRRPDTFRSSDSTPRRSTRADDLVTAESSTLPINKEAPVVKDGLFVRRGKSPLSSAVPAVSQSRRLKEVSEGTSARTGRSHITQPLEATSRARAPPAVRRARSHPVVDGTERTPTRTASAISAAVASEDIITSAPTT